MALKILSLNVRGLKSPFKRNASRKEAQSHRADILLIQETHFASTKDQFFQTKLFPHVFYANAPSKNRRVLVAVKDTVNREVEVHTDPNGRYIILLGSFNEQLCTIVNVYGPNVNQIQFF